MPELTWYAWLIIGLVIGCDLGLVAVAFFTASSNYDNLILEKERLEVKYREKYEQNLEDTG